MSDKQFWKLKKRPMTGIGIDDQLSLWNSLRQIVGVDRRDHDVVIAIHNEGRLLNIIELRVPFSTDFAPSDDRQSLASHCLRRARRIHVMFSEMPPLGPVPARIRRLTVSG